MRLKGHLIACLALLSIGSGPAPDGKSDYLAGSSPDDAPRPVYTPDPSDPWNRIFNLLFTRAVRFRLAGEFAGADAPRERVRISGFPDLPVSRAVFERIEGGDRGIEPLDPFPIHIGSLGSPTGVLDDPRFGRFRQALDEALGEPSDRLPPAPLRAVMQADLWAVHDLLIAARPRDEAGPARKEELLGRLARLVRKLALPRREIEGLPDNPRAGNDYSFPMSRPGRTESILAPLRMRCQACHGEKLGVMMTFAFHDADPPPVRALVKARDEHGQAVANRKMGRPDFLELKRRWDR